MELTEAQWTDTFFYQPEALPLSNTKTFLQVNVATAGSSSIEISEADKGVFVTAFKTAERTSKTTSALEQVYLNHLDILRLNKIRLLFDSQENSLRFSFHGKTFIISEFSDSEISEPHHSFLVPAILLMPEVLQLVVNLIQHLNEHPDGLEGKEAFSGGVLKQAEVNEYFIFPDMTLFPTYPSTSLCKGSSHCVPLSQYAWLVYSGHGKAAIISNPYSSDEPMDADNGKQGEGGEAKNSAYAPLPAGYTNFRAGNIGSGGSIGAGSGGEDNDPPERTTDYSRPPPEDRNEFGELEKQDNFIGKPDDSREASPEAPVTSDQASSETETTVTTPDTDAGAAGDISGGLRHWMFLKDYGTLGGIKGVSHEDVKTTPPDDK
ncbi:hypothetical protein [Endozoicomonas sp. 4G]|uniref:hypothetical protein n=1 Tax=Endozoicomonas sp. 4G TaxID=2872754 RepID=UPI0020791C09|nr:hypothetical protein [Endozoicomonas sp. 4G]